MDLWETVRHLFENDDGSLPDIFIEKVSDDEKDKIYSWVMSLTKVYGDPYLWDKSEQREIPVKNISNPARLYIEGKVESFRHGLEEFSMDDVKLPQLTIRLDENGVEFDYRMGKEWGYSEVMGLFNFLYKIKKIAPTATIFQADEGAYEKPNSEFSIAFLKYIEQRNVS